MENTVKKVSNKKRFVGIVISDKMDKTVVVRVDRLIKHPKYHKYVKDSRKFKAHDEKNLCREGDRVLIEESRPYSKTKKWRVVKILEKAQKLVSSYNDGGVENDSTGNSA